VTQRPDAPIRRGHAARLIAASFGKTLTEYDAIAFVLASSISNGRASATVAGYDANGFMSRAEAIVFVKRTDAHRAKLAEEAKGSKPPGQGAAAGAPGVPGGAGGGNPGSGGGNPGGGTGNPGGNGEERPGPVRSDENEQVLTALLEQRLAALGLTRTETTQGVAVSHPEREGGGAVLAQTEHNLGYVQVFDDANGAVLDAAHALLVYAGVAIDKQVYDDMIERVTQSGSNGAIKIGGHMITFVRGANPGQLTIHYTLMQ